VLAKQVRCTTLRDSFGAFQLIPALQVVDSRLADVTLPELLARRKNEKNLRAWVVGCSTGEEAYSLAVVFAETTQRLPQYKDYTLQIFASDLSPDAISVARRGIYPASIRAEVSPDRLDQFFTPVEGRYRIKKSIRDSVLFAQHDVILDPPFTKLDLISCRNLMIYFDSSLQQRLLPLFHYSLRLGGVLVLGSSETIGRFNRLFSPIDSKFRVYLRVGDGSSTAPDFMMKSFPPLSNLAKVLPVINANFPDKNVDSLQASIGSLLLESFTPPAVVVNKAGDVVYISGHTGKYLEPATGKANLNFYAMVREGLRSPIADVLNKDAALVGPIHLHGLQVQVSGGAQIVDVTVQPLLDPPALRGMIMIVFRDVVAVPHGRGRGKVKGAVATAHSAEVQKYRDEIQALREETQASKEELQSANEELQSTNEELQSANEELTSSKEEMQSMNEELQTVNSEMQTKLDDLALEQSDMKNLLNSTDIAILFLDQRLNVRRYTERAAKIINLRESDIGRPLSDLTTSLQYAKLNDDVQETLRTLVISEKEIPTSDGRFFTVRVMPYRRLDNKIDGAVITFFERSHGK
jgi:two-component system CheB/CheR fusion protein